MVMSPAATVLLRYCKKMGIQFQGFSPLGYGEFRKGHEIAPMRDPIITAIVLGCIETEFCNQIRIFSGFSRSTKLSS